MSKKLTEQVNKAAMDQAQNFADNLKNGRRPEFNLFLLKESLKDAGLDPEQDEPYRAVGFADGYQDVLATCRSTYEGAAREYIDHLIRGTGDPYATMDLIQMNMSRAGLDPNYDECWFQIHPEGRHGVNAYFMEACEDKASLAYVQYERDKQAGYRSSALNAVISYMAGAGLDVADSNDWSRIGAYEGVPEDVKSCSAYVTAQKAKEPATAEAKADNEVVPVTPKVKVLQPS